MRMPQPDLEPILHRDWKGHDTARHLFRQQQHQIGRRTVRPFARIGKHGVAPRSGSHLPRRVRVFDLDFRFAARLALDRFGPDMAAGRNVAAFDQRAAADEAPRRRRGIHVD
jgi:hypothetical protein